MKENIYIIYSDQSLMVHLHDYDIIIPPGLCFYSCDSDSTFKITLTYLHHVL